MLFSTQLKLKLKVELSLAMKHVYESQYLNEAKPDLQYEAIFNVQWNNTRTKESIKKI